MHEELIKFILSENLFTPGDRILLAVSGGLDSAVMTELFHQTAYRFGIAHCNFQLRSEDSERDELFVSELAKRMKVPFYAKRFQTVRSAKEKGISIQMAARELRYQWFGELLDREGFAYVATAHHLDDQAETFFINLMRSTGIAGLHGILPKQGKIIRPMLFTGRKNIEIFARDHAVVHREDKSNSETKYLRNKIRHEILPVLHEISPDFTTHLTENILRIREAESIFRDTVEKKRNQVVKNEGVNTRIAISDVRELRPVGTYLYEFLSPFGFNISQVRDLIRTLDKTPGKILLSPTHRLIRDRENILITPEKQSSSKTSSESGFQIAENVTRIRKPVKLSFRKLNNIKDFEIDPSPTIAFLDLKKLSFPLHLRKWEHGDQFYPFGRNYRKKLSDYFIDEKFSLPEKEEVWLLCSGPAIVWMRGMTKG